MCASDDDDDDDDDDVPQCVTKSMFRGMVTMVRALVAGLEHTYQSRGSGGMASTVMILEIMHTHYWEKEGSSKSDTSNQSLVRPAACSVLFCNDTLVD